MVGRNFGIADSGAWTAPFVVSPINTNKIYVGYTNIYYSENYGTNWKKQTNYTSRSTNTFRYMRISEKDDNYLYAATLSTLRVTKDGGETWTAIAHPGGGSGGSSISGLAIHPENPEIFFVTYSGFRENNKLYMYNGNTWINLSGNLPNVPANCVELHNNNGVLNIYVGTDIGVYHMINDIPYFKRWGQNLPNLYISQLEYVPVNNKMRAASYGRGIWEVDINNCEQEYINIVTDRYSPDEELVFCNGDSVRLYIENPNQTDIYWSTGETTNSIWIKNRGKYWAVSNSKSDCPSISNIVEFIVKDTSVLVINPSSSTNFCIGDSVILVASSGGIVQDSYIWQNGNDVMIGETTRRIIVREPGVYTVQAVTDETGCISKANPVTVNTFRKPEPTTIFVEFGTDYDTLIVSNASLYTKFQWYRNGIRINGATQRNYPVQKNSALADYTVTVAEGGDCFSEQSEPYAYGDVDDELTNVSKMFIKPNPAKDEFIIEMTESAVGEYDISILNVEGIIVKSISKQQIYNTLKVDISTFTIGVYIIKVSSKRNTFIKTLIKYEQ
jgi:hypothetical protein